MWYAVQTETGKEQELIQVIRLMVQPETYEKCFCMKREAVWRLKGECIVRKQILFPGYVFVVSRMPDRFYRQLKQIPYYARLLGREQSDFYSVSLEEEEFLESLLNGDEEDTVRLSPVIVNKKGEIQKYGGVLRQYSRLVVKQRIRLRYVMIRIELFGQQRDIRMGIRLAGDAGESGREFLNAFSSGASAGKCEDMKKKENMPETNRQDMLLGSGRLPDGISEGVKVAIMDGPFEGIKGTVKEIDEKKHTIGIEVAMFGRTQMVWVEWSVKIMVE